MTIATLIDKQDNFEIIRDQIAAILAAEVVNQMALATAALKDPNEWKLRIFLERFLPFEEWLNVQDPDTIDKSPIVNVWFENSTFEPGASNSIERQKANGIFNIDCYGYGYSSNNIAGGHNPGDKDSSFQAQKALRLVRNILMAADYYKLGLQGMVWSRWVQNITMYQPELNGQQVQQVTGARLAFAVSFNEFAPQVAEETLDYLSIDVKRTEDNQIVVDADYDYTI